MLKIWIAKVPGNFWPGNPGWGWWMASLVACKRKKDAPCLMKWLEMLNNLKICILFQDKIKLISWYGCSKTVSWPFVEPFQLPLRMNCLSVSSWGLRCRHVGRPGTMECSCRVDSLLKWGHNFIKGQPTINKIHESGHYHRELNLIVGPVFCKLCLRYLGSAFGRVVQLFFTCFWIF